MTEAARLAGFLAAHAMMQAARGVSLPPLVLFEKHDGISRVIQVDDKSPEKAALKGGEILRTNAQHAERGILAFDAFLNLPEGQTDAVFLQARQFVPNPRQLLFAVPYRHARKPGGFAIRRPKLFIAEDDQFPETEAMGAFFEGIHKHEKGGPFWLKHYQE